MKRIFAIVLFSAGIIQTNYAQVGIGTANPDSSSILEIQSTSKGVLFPKVALQGANIVAPLSNPAKGLIVWNTGTSWGSAGFYYNDSNAITPNWTKVASGAVMKTTLTDGKIWIGNVSNIATEQSLSGDITMTNAGISTISNDAVTSVKIMDTTIETNDIANNAITGIKINITGNTNGSFMYYDGVDWVNLAPDTAGKILQTNGAGAPTWVNANTLTVKNIYTTNGNLTGARTVTMGANNLNFASTSGRLKVYAVTGNFAFGDSLNTATNDLAMAVGRQNTSSGYVSMTQGWLNTASGTFSVAIGGQQNTASGYGSLTFGGGNNASGGWAVAANKQNTASGDNSFATGDNSAASGVSSSVFGMQNQASSFGEHVVGIWGTTYTPTSTNAYSATDRIFNVGNGSSVSARSDAFTILKNGNIGVKNNNPTNLLDISATARSGSHPSGLPLYVTGLLAAGSAGSTGIEFRHENGTQGIGFGFNTMYATGSNTSQDLGMRSKGTGNLYFSTDASPRMFISGTNGRVGIGTTSPSYLLDLNGGTFGFGTNNQRTETRDNAGLKGNAGAQSGFFQATTPTNFPSGATSNWHLIDARGSDTSANYAMQIAGSFFDQDMYFRKTNDTANTAWSKLLTMNSGWTVKGNAGTNDPAAPFTYGTTNFASNENWIGTTDGNDIALGTNSIERMRIKQSTGNVGIGTANPNALLQFANTIANRKMVLFEGANNDHQYYGLGINNSIFRYQVEATSASHVFYAATSAFASNELMRIQGNGNVGIGTPTPNANAILDLTSTNKGMLPPRLTSAQRDAITGTIPEGLMIYNIDNNCPEWFDTKSDPPGGPTGGFWNSHCNYCENTFSYSASSNGNGFFTQAGSPIYPQKWCVWINAGVILGANTQGGVALNFNGLPAGSEVIVYNYGSIIGGGGGGGGGAQQSDAGYCSGSNNAQNGGTGGAAINTSATVKVKIYNYGTIAGGGGGGGGGAGGCKSAGGGGGGGRGIPGGSGGYGWGTNSGYTPTNWLCTSCQGGPGSQSGFAGSAASFGNGRCSLGFNNSFSCGAPTTGGCGGNGGNYATAGNGGSGSNCGGAAAGFGGGGGAALNGGGSGSFLINFGSGISYGSIIQ